MSKIRASQLDYDATQFEEGGTTDRQLLIKDGGVGAAKLGFSWKTVEVAAASFAFDSTRSNYTLATAALSDSAITEQPTLTRNGVADLTRVTAPTTTTGEWSISGTTLSIHGDITTSGDTYVIEYLVVGGGGGPAGDDITQVQQLQVVTADATPAVMTTNGAVASSGNVIVLDDDSTYAFDILVAARRTDANDESAAYQLLACLDRNVGAATTALVGSVAKTVIGEDTAAWDVNATADTTLGALQVTVTGENSKDISWTAAVRRTKVTG